LCRSLARMHRSDFSYSLPAELIAQRPVPQRSASRLLCLEGNLGTITDRHFVNLPELLRPGDLLVFNNTEVIPARLLGVKDTAGKVEVLVESILDTHRVFAQVRANRAPKPGTWLCLEDEVRCRVIGRRGERFELAFCDPRSVLSILRAVGHVPLPPYIERCDEPEDRERYQTVFACRPGAIAAPTAGLHFDGPLLERLAAAGVECTFVTLHVGAGTFQPVRVNHVEDHRMHPEYVEVSRAVCDKVHETRRRGGRVVAVGTTVVRSLEAASQQGFLAPFRDATELFIFPGYRFVSIDALITNFHLPESSLLMLVCAFAGFKQVMAAYHHAVAKGYRFYSYGDAMFVAP
jgi:S-adenosylmethionine:tRNA ribosyltransferase-isomerase